MVKKMWLTKWCGFGTTFYSLWRNKPKFDKYSLHKFVGTNRQYPVDLCARPFEKHHPDLKMRAGEICQVEVKIKRITKPEKAK